MYLLQSVYGIFCKLKLFIFGKKKYIVSTDNSTVELSKVSIEIIKKYFIYYWVIKQLILNTFDKQLYKHTTSY